MGKRVKERADERVINRGKESTKKAKQIANER